jgi:hypothetical protein
MASTPAAASAIDDPALEGGVRARVMMALNFLANS